MRALVNEFIGDPALTAAYDLNGIAEAIGSHSGCTDLASDLEALRVVFVNLRRQVCAVAHHGVSATFSAALVVTPTAVGVYSLRADVAAVGRDGIPSFVRAQTSVPT